MEKTKRNLSGIYTRHKNLDTGEIENRVLEDLPSEEIDKFISNLSDDGKVRLIKMLCQTINTIGDEFDIVCS